MGYQRQAFSQQTPIMTTPRYPNASFVECLSLFIW